jgi:enoyl-[acyl-carrier protein] reductase II
MKNQLTEMLGIQYPIVQAPMGWIARSQLASAVSNAGGLGIIETSSGELDVIKGEIKKMRVLTDKPFGVNIAMAFVKDPSIGQFVIDQGISIVTTSAGNPAKIVGGLKDAGLTVFHVVPTFAAAQHAIDAGVDGLIVEGIEGGGFKSPNGVSSMVLIPLVAKHLDVPVIAAGGITDGCSMAAAFALGAQGVQMGTRMVSSAESPVHQNWKDSIIGASDQDTVLLNQFASPALRALKTERTKALHGMEQFNVFGEFGRVTDLYFGGDMESSIALTGQVAGRIKEVKPVAQIIEETMREYYATVDRMAAGN